MLKFLQVKFNHLLGCWEYTNVGDLHQGWEDAFLNQQGIEFLHLLKSTLGLNVETFFMMGKAKNRSSTVQKKETHGMIRRSECKQVKR